jgi:2-haloacid dehalogenase
MADHSAAAAGVLLLDVNETLTDMTGLDARFAEVLPAGDDPALVRQVWFARLLRDGFAMTAAGLAPSFTELARVQVGQVLAERGAGDPDAGADHVLGGLGALDLHPDVPDALRRLVVAGHRLVPFTNGSPDVAVGAFERGGVLELFETRLSVIDAGVWKPAAEAYTWAADRLGVPIDACTLVAIHPWDLMGAAVAGARSAWLRRGTRWPTYLSVPHLEADDLTGLADLLV